MTNSAPMAPHLAELLSQHRDEIATAWAKSVQSIPGSQYGQRSLSEVRSWLSLETEATVSTLATGSYAANRDLSDGTLPGRALNRALASRR